MRQRESSSGDEPPVPKKKMPLPVHLLGELPEAITAEVFSTLIETAHLRIERIVSRGQTTPAAVWLEQAQHEWVLLLTGAAELRFEGDKSAIALKPGDAIHIPAHCKHRVDWTTLDETTVWLAVHYDEDACD